MILNLFSTVLEDGGCTCLGYNNIPRNTASFYEVIFIYIYIYTCISYVCLVMVIMDIC